MAKKETGKSVPAATQAIAPLQPTTMVLLGKPTAPVALYNLGKLPRNGLNEGTKHGTGGTAGTYLAVCAALKDGPLSMAAIQAVCVAQNDKGFARYAVRNHWLQPVESK